MQCRHAETEVCRADDSFVEVGGVPSAAGACRVRPCAPSGAPRMGRWRMDLVRLGVELDGRAMGRVARRCKFRPMDYGAGRAWKRVLRERRLEKRGGAGDRCSAPPR